ncbi:MAG: 3-keto-5-aminohexanoate cleavage protein [Pseudolabrys sp.]
MRAVWLEAALNGPWGRDRQPDIPVKVEEIVADGIACAKAGAAIIHLHAYDAATGRQHDDWQLYARIIDGIRAACDAIVYPTIPIAGSGFAGALTLTPQQRYAHLDELAQRNLVEWAVVDPGSVNIARLDALAQRAPGFVYQNPDEHIFEGLRICAEHHVRPSYAIYEPGFTRMGAALAKAYPGLRQPVYRFMFSDQFAFGFPPHAVHLDAHLALLRENAPAAPWMIAGLGVDLRALVPAAVERGGHVRVGLEDWPLGARTTNVALVEDAARLIAAAGGRLATASEVRAACAAADLAAASSAA